MSRRMLPVLLAVVLAGCAAPMTLQSPIVLVAPTATATATSSPTATPIPTATATGTATPKSSPTSTPTPTATDTPTPTVTPGPTSTPIPQPRTIVPVPTADALDPGMNLEAATGLVCRFSSDLCGYAGNAQWAQLPPDAGGLVVGTSLQAFYGSAPNKPLYVSNALVFSPVDQVGSVIAHEATHVRDLSQHGIYRTFHPSSFCYGTEAAALQNQAAFWAWLYSGTLIDGNELYPGRDQVDESLFRLVKLAAASGGTVNPVAYAASYRQECEPAAR